MRIVDDKRTKSLLFVPFFELAAVSGPMLTKTYIDEYIIIHKGHY